MSLDLLPVRLIPGQDLRLGLEGAVAANGCQAAYVVSGIGSLRDAMLRFAGLEAAQLLAGDSELLTLSGSVAVDGSHLHATLADARGQVVGGHLPYGCTVRTTAEVLLALIRDWRLSRAFDPRTGFDELVITPAAIDIAAGVPADAPEGPDAADDAGDPDALRDDDAPAR